MTTVCVSAPATLGGESDGSDVNGGIGEVGGGAPVELAEGAGSGVEVAGEEVTGGEEVAASGVGASEGRPKETIQTTLSSAKVSMKLPRRSAKRAMCRLFDQCALACSTPDR
jgi:hypothetical protein